MTMPKADKRPKLTIDELKLAHKLFVRLYARHATGCCLHIVLDDNNVENEHVQWCVDYIAEGGNPDCEDRPECASLAALLLRMSRTQRLKLGASGYLSMVEN